MSSTEYSRWNDEWVAIDGTEYSRWNGEWVPVEGDYPPQVVRQNFDTWWPMDDGSGSATVADAVGSRDLSVEGSLTLNEDSISFSGTAGDRLVGGDSAGSFYGGLDQLTYFGWVRCTDNGRENVIASLYDTTDDNRSWFFRPDYGSDNAMKFNISEDGVNFSTPKATDHMPTAGEWASIAVVADPAANEHRFYVNGSESLNATEIAQTSFYAPSIDFWIGDLHYDGSRAFEGDMREHGFAQTALDAATIQQIHDATGP